MGKRYAWLGIWKNTTTDREGEEIKKTTTLQYLIQLLGNKFANLEEILSTYYTLPKLTQDKVENSHRVIDTEAWKGV